MTTTPTAADLEFLRSLDTPTVCNLIEMVAPERRGSFYTVKHLHCPFPELPPMVGFAKTVTIRTKDKVPLGEAGYMQKRLDYLDYVAAEPRPGIVVIEDLDGEARAARDAEGPLDLAARGDHHFAAGGRRVAARGDARVVRSGSEAVDGAGAFAVAASGLLDGARRTLHSV